MGLKSEGGVLMQYDMSVLVVDSIDDLTPPRALVAVELGQLHAGIISKYDLQLFDQLVDELVQSKQGVRVCACSKEKTKNLNAQPCRYCLLSAALSRMLYPDARIKLLIRM